MKKPESEEPDMVEVARDETGNLLWERPYIYKRLSAAGEVLVEQGIYYTVVESKLVDEITILTILRLHK